MNVELGERETPVLEYPRITDAELEFINFGPEGKSTNWFGRVDRANQTAWEALVRNSPPSLVSPDIIRGGRSRVVDEEKGKIYLDLDCEAPYQALGLEGTGTAGFDMLITAPFESLPPMPEALATELQQLIEETQIVQLEKGTISNDARATIHFLTDRLVEKDTKTYKFYQDPDEALEKVKAGLNELEIPQKQRERIYEIAMLKLKVYLSPAYASRPQSGETSTLSELKRGITETTDPTLYLNSPLFRNYISPVVGFPESGNHVFDKFAEHVRLADGKFLLLSGHGGGETPEEYRVGERFGGNQVLTDILARVDQNQYEFLVIIGCNPASVDLALLEELNIPVFFVEGNLSHQQIVSGHSTSVYYNPQTGERLTFRSPLITNVGLKWDETTKLYIRTR